MDTFPKSFRPDNYLYKFDSRDSVLDVTFKATLRSKIMENAINFYKKDRIYIECSFFSKDTIETIKDELINDRDWYVQVHYDEDDEKNDIYMLIISCIPFMVDKK